MGEKDYLFSEETVKFLEKNEDAQLNADMLKTIIDVATGGSNKGNTGKTMAAIAFATSAFLKMCADNAKGDTPLTALDYSEMFGEILRFYCMERDHPEKDDKE